MKNGTVVALFLSMISFNVSCQPIRTVSVTVIGDDISPIEDAEVVVWFSGYQPHQSKSKEGFTNEQGEYKASGQPLLSMITRVNKKGYYETESDKLLKSKDHDLTLTLRKKENPIPLYAKRWRVVTEHFGQLLGFDLEKGDWVKPYGSGENTDLFFTAYLEQSDYWTFDYRLEVSFPNELDGIQTFETIENSELRSPHLAPKKGYESTWVHTASRDGKKNRIIKNTAYGRNYWLRVRTKVDDQGEITSANYVKVYGNFPDFHYYFNPTPNDRNLEFDPQQNLLKGLNTSENPNDP